MNFNAAFQTLDAVQNMIDRVEEGATAAAGEDESLSATTEGEEEVSMTTMNIQQRRMPDSRDDDDMGKINNRNNKRDKKKTKKKRYSLTGVCVILSVACLFFLLVVFRELYAFLLQLAENDQLVSTVRAWVEQRRNFVAAHHTDFVDADGANN